RKARVGGAVFVGGVRRLELLEAFHTSVQLAQAGAGMLGKELRQRVSKQLRQEKEVVVSEKLFAAGAASLGQIGAGGVHVEGGLWRNELTKYRYDVVLRVTGGEDSEPDDGAEQREAVDDIDGVDRINGIDRIDGVNGTQQRAAVEGIDGAAQRWSWAEVQGLEQLQQRLEREQPERGRVLGVENARVIEDL